MTALREKGKTFDQISKWLNQKGYLSVRGQKFKGNHIHSIVNKKRLKDETLEREYPEVWSDYSLEVVDMTLVNMFEELSLRIFISFILHHNLSTMPFNKSIKRFDEIIPHLFKFA